MTSASLCIWRWKGHLTNTSDYQSDKLNYRDEAEGWAAEKWRNEACARTSPNIGARKESRAPTPPHPNKEV